MASIVPGYEYDIFISYRQKDNKYDGWVTEFVNNLKGELESTFKEEVSVYFDINPHDGLLETHDVDASLKDKLKCLVFIPIISRTYCDPKSFAWEHEFKAFVKQASLDQFGLKIKLPNSNVANRVLPVRIHDLDNEDIKLCESILGGVLRGIEFIYKESGFNRPLKPDDDEKINLNKTKYRNQITKVALAIKEIILGLKAEPVLPLKETIQLAHSLKKVDVLDRRLEQVNPFKFYKRKLFSGLAITMILIIAAMLVYPKIFKRDKLADLRSSDGRISVAVMPFQNMTNDTIWNVWQDGIQEIFTNSLSNSEELRVSQTETVKSLIERKGINNYAPITPSLASSISQTINADVFVYGKIIQSGEIIRVNAQLIDTKTEEVLKSFRIDGTEDKILHISDSLSTMVKDFLVISKLRKEIDNFASADISNSPEAYRFYINGCNAHVKGDYPAAVSYLKQALTIDSNLIMATWFLSTAYGLMRNYDEAKKYCLMTYRKLDHMAVKQKILTNWLYAKYFEKSKYNEIKSLKQLLVIDDQSPTYLWVLGRSYNELYQYENAIPLLEKALEICSKLELKPPFVSYYVNLGIAYHNTDMYKKEKELYKLAEQDFPDDTLLITRQAILSLTEGDAITANRYINKYKSLSKENSISEADINTGLASIYCEAAILDKAEVNYSEALSIEPKSPIRLNNLAYFLIDKDRNINIGMALVDTALKLSPDNYSYLHSKGWGLFKQGKYKEALELLNKSDSLKPIYIHELYLHLEAVKKAIANQK